MKINYKIKIRNIFLFLLFVQGANLVFSKDIVPFTYNSVRSKGMGGQHSALTDDFSVLFTNPAGFSSVPNTFSAAEIDFGIYGPVFDLINAGIEFAEDRDIKVLGKLFGPTGLHTGLDLVGPFAIGWMGEGLGFGFYNRAHGDISMTSSKVNVQLFTDLLALGGYSFRFPIKEKHFFDAGFVFKGFLRYEILGAKGLLDISQVLDIDYFDDLPFHAIVGIGLDLGLTYTFMNSLKVALTCADVYSPALDYEYASFNAFTAGQSASSPLYCSLAPKLNLGLGYELKSHWLEKYITSLLFMADYKDILDLFSLVPRHPILNASFGIELVILNALSLRAGIQDCLLSLGLGMDLTFMRLDVAMRGIEKGIDPGQNPQMAVDLALLFRY